MCACVCRQSKLETTRAMMRSRELQGRAGGGFQRDRQKKRKKKEYNDKMRPSKLRVREPLGDGGRGRGGAAGYLGGDGGVGVGGMNEVRV